MKTQQLNSPGARLRSARKAAGLSAAELGVRVAALAGRKKPISPSAIRNQENGTNGIPMILLSPYAEVLNVDPSYILLGDLPPSAGLLDAEEKAHIGYAHDRYFVSLAGMVSERWIETTSSGSSDFLGLVLEVPDFESDDLSVLEISDSTLEPTFPKGSYLVVANASDCPVYDGAVVILFSESDGILLECARRLSVTEDGAVEFLSVSGRPLKPIRPDSERAFYVDQVVVAAVTLFEPRSRRPVLLPEHIRPPELSDLDSTKKME